MIRLFRVFIPASIIALLISETLLVLSSFVLASYVVLAVDPTVFLLYDGGLLRIILVVVSIVLAMHFQDLYTRIHVKSRILLVQDLCLVMGIAFLAQGVISYLSVQLRMPLRIMLLGGCVSLLAIFSWRMLYSAYVLRVVGTQRLLLVGGSALLDEIAAHVIEHPELGMGLAGYVDDAEQTPRTGGKVLGPISRLREIALSTRPDRMVIGIVERRNGMPVSDLLELRFEGFLIEEVGSAYETVCGRIRTSELRPSQLIFSGELGPGPRSIAVQMLFNLAVALPAAILSLPVMMVSALAIRLSSPGPVIYRQRRVGLNGAPFTLYKFRSMRADAEAGTGAVWASPDDPRITRVGRILRKLRFDELPQLFNVLRGEMSIVGPRPERPEFVEVLSARIPYYRQRHAVKPGITGWAQINYKYGDTLEDTIKKLEFDLYYIKHISLALDSYILFHTVKTMLLSRGAQ